MAAAGLGGSFSGREFNKYSRSFQEDEEEEEEEEKRQREQQLRLTTTAARRTDRSNPARSQRTAGAPEQTSHPV